jgi:hypothetical protein
VCRRGSQSRRDMRAGRRSLPLSVLVRSPRGGGSFTVVPPPRSADDAGPAVCTVGRMAAVRRSIARCLSDVEIYRPPNEEFANCAKPTTRQEQSADGAAHALMPTRIPAHVVRSRIWVSGIQRDLTVSAGHCAKHLLPV